MKRYFTAIAVGTCLTAGLAMSTPASADIGPCNTEGYEGLLNSKGGLAQLAKVIRNRNTNAGPGNGGELTLFLLCLQNLDAGEVPNVNIGDFSLTDPGNSGDNNNAPDHPPGQD